MIDIKEKVAQKLVESGERVIGDVIDLLTNSEINRRIQIVVKAVSKIENDEKILKKLDNPDITTYDDKKVKADSYSAHRIADITKTKESLDKLKALFNKTLETSDIDNYNKLEQLINAGANKESSKSEVIKEELFNS